MPDWGMLIADTPRVLVERINAWQADNGPANAAQLVEVFAEFCDEPVADALPIEQDGDALLLQYGSTSLRAQPVFQIDCVRQLIKAADDVDEQTIHQLHMSFYWPQDDETLALGWHNAWLMGYEPDAESEAFWEGVLGQPGWEWFLSGYARDCRCEIWFEDVDEASDVQYLPYSFGITSDEGVHPVVLPYPYNQQPVGLWLGGPDEIAPVIEQQLRDQIWLQLVLGAWDASEFVDNVAVDYAPHLTPEQIEAHFDRMAGWRNHQQQAWGTELPKTNLTRAFEALTADGILALEDFTCCGTCAATEVWDEVDRADPQPLYVYYHHQNAERFATGRSGWVGFGLVPSALGVSAEQWQALPEAERTRRHRELTEELVRTRVLPVFAEHGIEVVWDGSAATNLHLVGADFYS